MTGGNLPIEICKNLGSLRSGTLSFWGDWFGRPYDNIHTITGADAIDDSVVIYFNMGESLIVKAPQNWSISNGCLLIDEAESVRFQWFYYGHLPSRETMQFVQYHRRGDKIDFSTDFIPKKSPQISLNAPAVEIHAFPG